jgi:peptide/nickel transport system substrate-binding protein
LTVRRIAEPHPQEPPQIAGHRCGGGRARRRACGCAIAIPTIEPTVGWVIYDTALVNPRGVNWGCYSSPAVDKALADIRLGFTEPERNAAMAKLHTVLVDEAAALFVVHDLNPRAYSPCIEGFVQAQNWFQDHTTVRMR